MIIRYYSLPVASCRPNIGVSDGCLDGVWGCLAVSGWYLSVSGRCLGWVDVICSAKNTRKQHGWVKMTPKNTKKGQKTPKMPYFSRIPKDPSAIFFRQLFPKRTAQTFQMMYEPPMICFFWPGLRSAPLCCATFHLVQQSSVEGIFSISLPHH